MASPKSAPKDAQVRRGAEGAVGPRAGLGRRGGAERCLSALQVMAQILKDMGITEYEPRVINQMLEFAYSKRRGPGPAGTAALASLGEAEGRRGMLVLAVCPRGGVSLSVLRGVFGDSWGRFISFHPALMRGSVFQRVRDYYTGRRKNLLQPRKEIQRGCR